MDKAEENGDEEQRGDCREQQPADDGAAKRRILLAAFAHAQAPSAACR
jgi:hypothetical protein